MSISSAAIIDLATANNLCDIPAQVRSRLEWTWGLELGHLDEHLLDFEDHERILTNEADLVFPRNEIIRQLASRDNTATMGVRRVYIQKVYDECNMFEYLVVPTTADSPMPPRIITSGVPPHLVLCTTHCKMLKAWGNLPRKLWDANRASVVERAKAVPHSNARPALGMWQLTRMDHIHSKWTWTDYVPPSFLSGHSDLTAVQTEDNPITKRKSIGSDLEASNSPGSHFEPKRRLLPPESESPPLFVVQLLSDADEDDDEDDDDDAISNDSYISGVEGDPEEFSKASMARGDYELDPRWLKGIRRWAKRTSSADGDETLHNDEQINDDPREHPRDAASLDLRKPDYLLRDTRRMEM
ncbi:hypothetical protein C8R45DRAFT_1161931 [Mycena sanguinolenta]|nr:hypothetical protein C8R45DRAFT_1161931 [Mycena sanguinolenta]